MKDCERTHQTYPIKLLHVWPLVSTLLLERAQMRLCSRVIPILKPSSVNLTVQRTLYEKYLGWAPSNSAIWIKFAELEAQLQGFARTCAIFELVVSQLPLSMPEII
ncbi:hypothetical protein CVT26_000973 [Gymnopilus dilepis]|uniref:Uncharacterized protein n=1 Tax=Gymnopilus dilepis TaxID=231916 RepID=A0A409WB60_9AGAR|nr:hypothetical protein CVT26_000973 [Gymnopilus dilepis]